VNGSIYERELMNILIGTKNTLDRITKNLDPVSKDVVYTMMDKPFYVARAAGSFGADLVALRDDYSLVIEVKSSSRSQLTFSEASGTKQDQALKLHNRCILSGLFITYAYRLKNYKGDFWRFFSIESDYQYRGKMRGLYELLPKQEITRTGNYILRWEGGLPLTTLVNYLNS
jgi:Holliday junction resolvase